MSGARVVPVEVEGRTLELSNLDKLLWPKAEWTKAHLIDYCVRVAPALLPHLRGRALTLKRYPDGVEGPSFYEKECPAHAPAWVRRAPIASRSRGGDVIRYCVVDDLASLVWVANLADLELHPSLAKVDDPWTPTVVAFDLDPGPGADVVDCARVALRLRALLRGLDLEAFPKTSGSKGMQVYVPLNTPASFEATKTLAREAGRLLERETPREVTTSMSKARREGRVLVDWAQNDAHKTTVCVYSPRALEQPTVSTPMTWAEVERVVQADDAALARFRAPDVLERLERLGDVFAPVLDLRQALPPAT